MKLAIICNSLPPYRRHFHLRVAREAPNIQIHTVLTHEMSNSPWDLMADREILPIQFGPGESSEDQARFGRALHEWRKGGRIIRWMVANRIDAVLMNGYNDPGRLRILRWCSKHRVPCALWADSNILGDNLLPQRIATLKRWILPRIMARFAAVMVCGRLGVDYARKYGVPDSRIFLSPVEPDYQLITQVTPSQIQAAMADFSLAPARNRLLYVGRLVEVKRVDLLLKAMNAIAQTRPEWDLVIAGGGPLQQRLESIVTPEVRPRVIWTGFINDQTKVSALYHCCHALVLPSDYEPWALVINEAAAAGLAIVASDVVGAAAELVTDGVNGRIFSAGDLASLIDCLIDVTAPGRFETMGPQSQVILEQWQLESDPVEGLQQALEAARVAVANHSV